MHGHVSYPCVQCDYKTVWTGSLKFHIESKHGNNTYACNQCRFKAVWKGFKAVWKGSLKLNIESKHGNVPVISVNIRQLRRDF